MQSAGLWCAYGAGIKKIPERVNGDPNVTNGLKVLNAVKAHKTYTAYKPYMT